jgi:hypothetical protein
LRIIFLAWWSGGFSGILRFSQGFWMVFFGRCVVVMSKGAVVSRAYFWGKFFLVLEIYFLGEFFEAG